MTHRETANSGYETLTAVGEPAALACIRIVGPDALTFANRHLQFPRPGEPDACATGALRRAVFLDADGVAIDDVVVSIHEGAAGRRGLDLRVHFHGGVWPIERCCELLRARGFVDFASSGAGPPLWTGNSRLQRLAWRLLPEFRTLTGSRWLAVQAMHLPSALRAVVDTAPGEGWVAEAEAIAARLRFAKWFLAPLRIALIGPPNAGKSTLLNALAGETVSLVSPRAGTTRDWVEAPGEIAGYPVEWIDTAGLRGTTDEVESAGINLTRELLSEVDAVVAVVDGCDDGAGAVLRSLPVAAACIAANKCDDPAFSLQRLRPGIDSGAATPVVAISALTGVGLSDLKNAVLAACGRTSAEDEPAAFTPEIADALRQLAAGDGAAVHELLAADPV